MKTQTGVWILLNQKPSDFILNGLPRQNETVGITYRKLPWRGIAQRIGSEIEDKTTFQAKRTGMTTFYSAI